MSEQERIDLLEAFTQSGKAIKYLYDEIEKIKQRLDNLEMRLIDTGTKRIG